MGGLHGILRSPLRCLVKCRNLGQAVTGHPEPGGRRSALEKPGQPCFSQPAARVGTTENKVRVRLLSSAWATAAAVGAEVGQMRASEAVGTLRLGMDPSEAMAETLQKGLVCLHGSYLHSRDGDSGTLGARST